MPDWHRLLTQYDPRKAESYRAEGYWGSERLDQLIARAAMAAGGDLAVVDPRGRWSYAELHETAEALARGLAVLGVRSGDSVVIQLPNWREVNALVAACSRLGAVFTTIAPMFRERDLARMLSLAQPKAFITVDTFRGFDHARLGKRLVDELDVPTQLIILGDAAAGAVDFRELLSASHHTPPPSEPNPAEVVQLAFTSGTTGEPKGILHTHETILHPAYALSKRYGLTQSDRLHMASTLGHQTGILYGVYLPAMLACPAILQDSWNPNEFCRLVEEEGITWTCGAIPYLSDALSCAEFPKRNLTSLRLFGCFGSGLPRTLAERSAEMLPRCVLFGGWGMTECGLPICNPPTDPLEFVCETDGTPVPDGAEIQIRDESLKCVRQPGEVGELLFRGPGRHLGFLQPKLSETLFLEDDWYVTGDRGYIRDDGYFVMVARSKDIIVRGGENIPVFEVENLLLKHPSVRACAVVAYPDERMGERACACVQLHPQRRFEMDEMREWIKANGLTTQYWPERLEIFGEGEMPMTASGKIQKAALRELVATPSSRPC